MISGMRRRWLRTRVTVPPRDRALVLSERLAAVSHLIASLEYLAAPADRAPGGLNDWTVQRDAFIGRSRLSRVVLDGISAREATTALHVARVIAACTVLAPTPAVARWCGDGALALSSAMLHPRQQYGSDGADQAAFVVQTAATIARSGRGRAEVTDACLWFVAMQSVLSYTASGWLKLTSPTWRNGQALPGVLRTVTFGDRTVWRMVQSHRRSARLAGSAVLAAECLFPLVYARRGRIAPTAVAAMGAFHLFNARVMGLNRFTCAFASTYPALLYTTRPHASVAERHDSLPRMTAAMAVAAMLAAWLGRVRRRHRVLAGRPDEVWMITSSGRRLSYRSIGPDPGEHTIVLVSGLGADAEHWEWIAQELAARARVITYARAGYGRSDPDRTATITDTVNDLVELVEHVAGSRPVVLIGHSLGGYLAMRAANARPSRVSGLVVIDTNHPEEMRRSSRRAEAAPTLSRMLVGMAISTWLGLGSLAQRPVAVEKLPERVRDLATDHHRDARLWTAARHEWRAMLTEFAAETSMTAPAIPTLAITAEYADSDDPVHAALHDEIATSAPQGQRVIIAGADHKHILTDERLAAKISSRINAFLSTLTDASVT